MQQSPLDLHTNPHRNPISKKSYNSSDEFLRQSLLGKTFSDSFQKLVKYTYTHPQSSDIYIDTIRKINQISRRIQDRYRGKKSLHSLLDYIEQNTIRQKQNIGYIHQQEDIPIKIIAPEGSRVLTTNQNSTIVFPPQIIQVRPLSTPKPELYHTQTVPIIPQTIIQSNTPAFRSELTQPSKIIYHQPIIRRNSCKGGNRIVSVPLPQGQQYILKSRTINQQPNIQTFVQPYPIMPIQQTQIVYRQNPQPTLIRSASQNFHRPQSTMSSTSYQKISISPSNTNQSFHPPQPPTITPQQISRIVQEQYRNYNRSQSTNKQNIIHHIVNMKGTNNPHNPLINLKKQKSLTKRTIQSQNSTDKIKNIYLNNQIDAQLNQITGFEEELSLDKQLSDLNDLRNMKKQKQLIKKMNNILQKYGQSPPPLPPPTQPITSQPQYTPITQSIVNKFTLPSIFKTQKQKKTEQRIFPDNFYQIPKITENPQILTTNDDEDGQILKFTKTVVNQFKQIFNL